MLQLTETVDSSPWDAALEDIGGTVFHSSAFARYIEVGYPNTSARFATLTGTDDDRLGMAAVYYTRSSKPVLGALTGRLWLTSMPVIRAGHDEALGSFIEELEAAARSMGCVEIELGSSAAPVGGDELARRGFEVRNRLEFELAIDRDDDALWADLERSRRKNIKKASRSGVVLRDLGSEQGVAELRRLQGHSSERIMARGGRDITFSRSADADPAEVLVDSPWGRIVAAEVDDRIVSVGLFTCFNGLVYHTLSGHSDDALQTQAPTLLLWETIRRYRDEGATRFNFGGCSSEAVREGHPEHGVYRYKKAFGGRCLSCTSGRKVLRPAAHRAVRTVKSLLHR